MGVSMCSPGTTDDRAPRSHLDDHPPPLQTTRPPQTIVIVVIVVVIIVIITIINVSDDDDHDDDDDDVDNDDDDLWNLMVPGRSQEFTKGDKSSMLYGDSGSLTHR